MAISPALRPVARTRTIDPVDRLAQPLVDLPDRVAAREPTHGGAEVVREVEETVGRRLPAERLERRLLLGDPVLELAPLSR